MSPEKQRIAIAEACGLLTRPEGHLVEYRRWEPPNHIFERVKFPDGSVRPCYIPDIPDYLNDLNAMHEAEARLELLQTFNFAEALGDVLHLDGVGIWTYHDAFKVVNTTATQRAEAFLRTIGKWEDL